VPPHFIRDIALQAGLSEATVDRVLHQRPGVSRRSLALVKEAIAKLDRQQEQNQIGGWRVTIEVVIEEPGSGAGMLATAISRELADLRPRIAQGPIHILDHGQSDEVAEALRRIRKSRQAQGVFLYAEHHPAVEDESSRLMASGIPVVSVNSYLPEAASLGTIGLDETAAGATAAYLLHQSVPLDRAIAVVMPDESEPQHLLRRGGFDAVLAERRPERPGVTLTAHGELTGHHVLASSAPRSTVSGLYLLDVPDPIEVIEALRVPDERWVIVADGTAPALELLRRGALDFVIDTNWSEVVRRGSEAILDYRSQRPGRLTLRPSPALILTPYTVPYHE
jgi:LacI family transcriptional regulator